MRLAICVFFVGCGRIGFDAGDDAGHDAIADAAQIEVVGELDPTFGVDGVFILPGQENVAWDVTATAARVFVTGVDFPPVGNGRLFVATLTTAGALDTSLISGGLLTANASGSTFGYAIELLPDGSLIVVGDSAYGTELDNIIVAHVTVAGTLDLSWGASGFTDVDVGNREDSARTTVVHNGIAYVCGVSGYNQTDQVMILVAVDVTTGALVTDFGTQGVVTHNPSAGTDVCRGIATDGTILFAAGAANDMAGYVRFDRATGTAFSTFAFPGGGVAFAMERASDGAMVFASYEDGDGVLTRIVGGAFDASFGQVGRVILPPETYEDIVLDASGRIIVVGERNGAPFVTRYTATGALDMTFGAAGIVTVPTTGALHTVTVDPVGHILAAGRDASTGVDRALVVRIR